MILTAVVRLHYGADYLPWVIESALAVAPKVVLLYTETSNFRPELGRDGNPDSRETLYEIASRFPSNRVLWTEGLPIDVYSTLKVVTDTDAILELDADEVIAPSLGQAITERLSAGQLTAQVYRLPMLHFWRSFNYVCRNPGWPTRLFLPHATGDAEAYWEGGESAGVIYHFGYARRRADIDYKVKLSMHREEWRADWWEAKYNRFPDVLADVHPTCEGMWDAQPFDRLSLPAFLHNHPYFNEAVIE
jgi:hypothetical protein